MSIPTTNQISMTEYRKSGEIVIENTFCLRQKSRSVERDTFPVVIPTAILQSDYTVGKRIARYEEWKMKMSEEIKEGLDTKLSKRMTVMRAQSAVGFNKNEHGIEHERVPIYKKTPTTKNFRVNVYRNGDRSRYVECMSCSMETLFAAATAKFQMSTMFKRLFDFYGHEIFESRTIIRGMEYYVSLGENFIDPFHAFDIQFEFELHTIWTIYGIIRYYMRRTRQKDHQKEKPDRAKEITAQNDPDIIRPQYPTSDQTIQVNQRLPQTEHPDCPTRHLCSNSNDLRKTCSISSNTDPLPVAKRSSTQCERSDCPKYQSCLIAQDKMPTVNQSTQTIPPKPKKERIDVSKSPSTAPQPDPYRMILIEYFDFPKPGMSPNATDKLPGLQEHYDEGKRPNTQQSNDVREIYPQTEDPDHTNAEYSSDPPPSDTYSQLPRADQGTINCCQTTGGILASIFCLSCKCICRNSPDTPVNPSPPSPTDPVKPSPPSPTKPIKPSPPAPTDPVKPSPPSPTEPINPTPPSPTKPIKPSPPAPTDPVKPSPLAPIDPVKSSPPSPTEPIKPLPPAPSEPVKPSPSRDFGCSGCCVGCFPRSGCCNGTKKPQETDADVPKAAAGLNRPDPSILHRPLDPPMILHMPVVEVTDCSKHHKRLHTTDILTVTTVDGDTQAPLRISQIERHDGPKHHKWLNTMDHLPVTTVEGDTQAPLRISQIEQHDSAKHNKWLNTTDRLPVTTIDGNTQAPLRISQTERSDCSKEHKSLNTTDTPAVITIDRDTQTALRFIESERPDCPKQSSHRVFEDFFPPVRRSLLDPQTEDPDFFPWPQEKNKRDRKPQDESEYKSIHGKLNFRVRVYNSKDISQYAYCRACSMDRILSDANQKLSLARPAHHLYDSNNKEIKDHRDIEEHKSYYVA